MLDTVRILKNVADQNNFDVDSIVEIRADSHPVDFYIQLWQSDLKIPHTPASTSTVNIEFLRADTVDQIPQSQFQSLAATAPFGDKSIWKVTLEKTNVEKITSGGFRVTVNDTLPTPVLLVAAPGTPGASRSGNIVTLTTTTSHNFSKEQTVLVQNMDDSTFDGTFTILTVPSTTTITYIQIAANGTSANGTVQLTPDPPFKRTIFSRMTIRKLPDDQNPLIPLITVA